MSQQTARPDARSDADEGLVRTRADRITVLAFVNDSASEQVLRDSLGELPAGAIDVRRGSIRAAILAMGKLATPEVLIVDVSNEDQPLRALGELSDVVEPGVTVLVIGDTDDVGFYRHIIRFVGVREYIFKPITREAVARHFAPLISRDLAGAEAPRGGRVIAVIGARGGAGATTISANLAWYLGVAAKRHTVLLESDLQMAAGAALLGGKTGLGLRAALEAPAQIDAGFIARNVEPVAERLHILAGEAPLESRLAYAEGAAKRLIEALRVRYNFIIVDVPFLPEAWNRDLFGLAHHRVIVMEPNLAGLRDALRLIALPKGRFQPQSPTILLNRSTRPGGLTQKQIETALKQKIDIVIPDLPKQFSAAAAPGEPGLSARGPFREAIIALSREVGFVSGRDDSGAPASPRSSAWRLLLQQRRPTRP